MIRLAVVAGYALFVLVTWQLSPNYGKRFVDAMAYFQLGMCFAFGWIFLDEWIGDRDDA